eukprot:COSAG06_NODE_262_length_18897_cov_122.542877_12_plen_107_part_00
MHVIHYDWWCELENGSVLFSFSICFLVSVPSLSWQIIDFHEARKRLRRTKTRGCISLRRGNWQWKVDNIDVESQTMQFGFGGKKTALFSPFIYKMHYFTKTGSGQS